MSISCRARLGLIESDLQMKEGWGGKFPRWLAEQRGILGKSKEKWATLSKCWSQDVIWSYYSVSLSTHLAICQTESLISIRNTHFALGKANRITVWNIAGHLVVTQQIFVERMNKFGTIIHEDLKYEKIHSDLITSQRKTGENRPKYLFLVQVIILSYLLKGHLV